MKLSKAVEILKDYRDGVEMEELREYPIVLSLAIEALKREIQLRQMAKSEHIWLLPGETED